jgi:hypothetical protein
MFTIGDVYITFPLVLSAAHDMAVFAVLLVEMPFIADVQCPLAAQDLHCMVVCQVWLLRPVP